MFTKAIFGFLYCNSWVSLTSQGFSRWLSGKNLPEMQEMQLQSLGHKDPLEKEMATHSSILAWEIPMDRGAWRATVHVVAKKLDVT